LIGAAFGALWYVDNKDRVPYLAQRWAIKAAFHGQEFAPWSRYESLVPSASKALQLTPRQLAFALNKSRKQSMKNSNRFQLGAAAWKCILEHSERCFQQAASGPMGGATLTMVAAIDFLEAARNKGNTDAAADVGLIYVIHHGGLLDSVMRARTEWTKSVQENPESVRAQALLDLSSNSLALHTAAWISQQTRM
jgi:hypothetical protein